MREMQEMEGVKSGTRLRDLAKPPCGLYRVSLMAPSQKQLSHGTELMAQTVKNLPAMQETPVRSLGQEDPLEGGLATYSRILAWRIPWTEEPGRL